MAQMSELRHRLEDMSRKWDKSDRTSESIVDEFHQMKNKLEMQVRTVNNWRSNILFGQLLRFVVVVIKIFGFQYSKGEPETHAICQREYHT